MSEDGVVVVARPLRVIGLMSGTSLDGCDAVLVEIAPLASQPSRVSIDTLGFITHPMPANLRDMIRKQLQPPSSRIDELTKLDAALSHWFVDAVQHLLAHCQLTAADVDLIGSHGQTMWHDVNTNDNRMTWQLGDGSFIAALTGITTICDFRTADVALGGQGAPLIPFFDHFMYGGSRQTIALQNIGGIGNVTYIPRQDLLSKASVLGFDTGPGNMIMDRFVDRITNGQLLYDEDGKYAAKGTVCKELLDRWMQHPFFHQLPPKSTGREQFGHDDADEKFAEAMAMGLSAEDAVATATALTAHTIGLSYKLAFNREEGLFPEKVIVAGGGARNPTLMSMIAEQLSPAVVTRSGDAESDSQHNHGDYICNISSDAKEAIAFAVFAYQAVFGRSNHLPSTTGASKQIVLGKICPGYNFQQLILLPRGPPSSSFDTKVSKANNDSTLLVTESRNEASTRIDSMSAEEIVDVMNREDIHVAKAVQKVKDVVAKVANLASKVLQQGGHVFYIGAGSSGRIGVLDASEIPPTFSAPSDWFQGVIAGGDTALRNAVEGAEDHREQGGIDILARGITEKDLLIGIASSGSTPYVHGALQASKEQKGSHTALLTCNPIGNAPSYVDIVIEVVVGPEIVTGSTRLKAGTATKMILNQISTTAMILNGKTFGNLMVDLRASNVKLRRRAQGIIQTITGLTDQVTIEDLLLQAGGKVKLAIVMYEGRLNKEDAELLLQQHEGRLGSVLDFVHLSMSK